MKTIYKVIFLLILANGLIFISQSCWTRCGKHAQIYKTDSIQGQAVILMGIDSISNIYKKQHFISNYAKSNIRYDSVAFEFKTFVTKISQNMDYNFGYTNAYACDPAFSSDGINAVKITSDKDYNLSYAAGTDLYDIVKASNNRDINASPIITTLQISIFSNGSFLLRFVTPPSENLSHNLTFTFSMTSGKVFVKTINQVLITK